MTNGTETMVKIKWVFTPADFLEEKISLEREGYAVEIDNGEIWARMAESRFEAQPGIREMIAAERRCHPHFWGHPLPHRSRPWSHGLSIQGCGEIGRDLTFPGRFCSPARRYCRASLIDVDAPVPSVRARIDPVLGVIC